MMLFLQQIIDLLTQPFKWWVTVAPWEMGLRVRLGKTATVLKPGIHFKIPLLDRIYVQSIRRRTLSFTGITVSTKDGKTCVYGGSVQYAIKNILDVYNSVANVDNYIKDIATATISEHIATRNACDINFDELMSSVVKLQKQFDVYGFDDIKCWICQFAFVKTYRLISNEYATTDDNSNLEQNTGERR